MKLPCLGVHRRVLEGGGMMDDALQCVDCGADSYFLIYIQKRKRPVYNGYYNREEISLETQWKHAAKKCAPRVRSAYSDGHHIVACHNPDCGCSEYCELCGEVMS